jgi:hypothetical protein
MHPKYGFLGFNCEKFKSENLWWPQYAVGKKKICKWLFIKVYRTLVLKPIEKNICCG